MKRLIACLLLAGVWQSASAQELPDELQWLYQQAWHKECMATLPHKLGPRAQRLTKECTASGHSEDECRPLVYRANLNAISDNYAHSAGCYEQNLSPAVAACTTKEYRARSECLLMLDTREGRSCAEAVTKRMAACLAKYAKAEMARTPLIRDPLKVVLPSGITLHDWIAAARQRAGQAGEAQALFDESTAHIRAYGPHPDIVALRDQSLARLLSTLRVTNEEQAREFLPRLEALQKLAGNSTLLQQPLGKARHFLGDFDKARQHYSAALQAMKPDAAERKNVVAILSQIEKREKPSAMQLPPEVFAAYEYLKGELPGAMAGMTGEPLQFEVNYILSALVRMGDIDEALAQFDKLRPLRKAGKFDNPWAVSGGIASALASMGEVARAVQFADSLPDDPDKNGSFSMRRSGYEDIISALRVRKRWSEARQFLPQMRAQGRAEKVEEIEFFEAGADEDAEKAFTFAMRGAKSSWWATLFLKEEALKAPRIRPERVMEMARLIPNETKEYDPSDKSESRRLLLKAGLCEEAKAYIASPPKYLNRASEWREVAECRIKRQMQQGDLPAAEASMNRYLEEWRQSLTKNYQKESLVLAIGKAMNDRQRALEWSNRVLGEQYQWEAYGDEGKNPFLPNGSDAITLHLLEERYADAWQAIQSRPKRESRISHASLLISLALNKMNDR